MKKFQVDKNAEKFRVNTGAGKFVGWKYIALISGIVGFIGLNAYHVIFKPMYDNTEYKKIQEIVRAGIQQDKIQPGNMRVWSDPFKPLPGKEDG